MCVLFITFCTSMGPRSVGTSRPDYSQLDMSIAHPWWLRELPWEIGRFFILWIKVEVTLKVLVPVAIMSVRTTCILGRMAYQIARRHCHDFFLKYGLDLKCLNGYSAPFVCDCCCLRLDRRQMDMGYHQSCSCDAGGSVQYCFQCVRTYVEGQVTENQATQLVCMATRQCRLDDRLVRARLSATAVSILDRNQVLEASRQTGSNQHIATDERLWHCPAPDCSYVCFITTATSRDPSPGRLFGRPMYGPDMRRILCPNCRVASCQVCSTAWSTGAVDHAGITCAAYAERQATADGFALLEQWKMRAGVQPCRRCHAAIEKTAGCDHMTCRCGYEFCWICGLEWSRHSLATCRRPSMALTTSSGLTNDDGVTRDEGDASGWQRFVAWARSWFHT
jgi:IBR domain, a half RING-finger domain